MLQYFPPNVFKRIWEFLLGILVILILSFYNRFKLLKYKIIFETFVQLYQQSYFIG